MSAHIFEFILPEFTVRKDLADTLNNRPRLRNLKGKQNPHWTSPPSQDSVSLNRMKVRGEYKTFYHQRYRPNFRLKLIACNFSAHFYQEKKHNWPLNAVHQLIVVLTRLISQITARKCVKWGKQSNYACLTPDPCHPHPLDKNLHNFRRMGARLRDGNGDVKTRKCTLLKISEFAEMYC